VSLHQSKQSKKDDYLGETQDDIAKKIEQGKSDSLKETKWLGIDQTEQK